MAQGRANCVELKNGEVGQQGCLGDVLVEPREPVEQTVAGNGARLLDVPRAVAQLAEAQLLCDLLGVHCLGQVRLVRKDKQHCVLHLAVGDDAHQLRARLVNPLVVRAVHNKDQRLRPRKVMPPQRTDLVLASNILFDEW